jgi:hydroxymethylpyrimidine kinase/phosphomethylpyrimidine kinase
VDEVRELTGDRIAGRRGVLATAASLQSMGVQNVLIKGGHLPGEPVDFLLTDSGSWMEFRGTRVKGALVHGTGCALSAAVTGLLASGLALADAVRIAKERVARWIASAERVGRGHRIMMSLL